MEDSDLNMEISSKFEVKAKIGADPYTGEPTFNGKSRR